MGAGHGRAEEVGCERVADRRGRGSLGAREGAWLPGSRTHWHCTDPMPVQSYIVHSGGEIDVA